MLPVMKVLCVYGNGTNSNVMELQTAALRHELADGYEYEFIEAILQAPMSTGVDSFSLPGHSFYAFYNPEDLSTLRDSITHLDNYISTEGPFDVIMGFSGGSVLAAAYILEKQRQHSAADFKCGIFLSSAECRPEMHYLGLGPPHDLIRIPTVHIWGTNDSTAPTGGQDLSEMCTPTLRLIVIHDGGHEVPRGDRLIEAVHAIRRSMHTTTDGFESRLDGL